MGKKSAEVMAKMRGKFVDGAKKLGTGEKKAAQLFDLMEHFAGYGFNKSHSTAYAILAYQTAYLKANYPWHFAAGPGATRVSASSTSCTAAQSPPRVTRPRTCRWASGELGAPASRALCV